MRNHSELAASASFSMSKLNPEGSSSMKKPNVEMRSVSSAGDRWEAAVERKKYPIGAEEYTLLEEVGQGVSASVYRALCVPFDEVVAIKILDFERNNSDLARAEEIDRKIASALQRLHFYWHLIQHVSAFHTNIISKPKIREKPKTVHILIGEKLYVFYTTMKGSVLGDEAEVPPLQKTGKTVFRNQKAGKIRKGEMHSELPVTLTAFYHVMGIYAVGVCRVRHAGLSTESGRVQVRSISKPDRVRPEELVEEIARVVGDGREDIEEENLQRMSYLKAE